jgi:hypothetical protein
MKMTCPKCHQVGCEDGECMEYIALKKTFILEIPKHKYNQLKQELKVNKLFQLEDNLIEISRRLERMAEEQVIENIEIDDGDY